MSVRAERWTLGQRGGKERRELRLVRVPQGDVVLAISADHFTPAQLRWVLDVLDLEIEGDEREEGPIRRW